jgi:2-dehydro-3-deoxyphosphogluconate aldolase/(4S)-4-hydroxy-2-oxoglutarate aldolase
MSSPHPNDADALMRLCPVIPVLTIERLEDAAPLALALVAGGLRVLEVTLRTPVAIEAIGLMAAAAPEALVGAGTVLSAADYDRAAAAGARFIVSPGLTEPLIAAARAAPLPLLPGVATATEVMRGLDAGLNRFKFFPAETSGGPAALKALFGPFGDCRFCPTGGIGAATAGAYLALPNVLCVGGAWVAPASAVKAGDWGQITALARAAAGLRQE